MGYRVKVMGTGSYLPGEPVKFDDLDKVLGKIKDAPSKVLKWMENANAFFKNALSIETYHFAIDPVTREFTETNITMAVKAAQKAIDMAGINSNEIEMLIFGCSNMEQIPPPSTRIQEILGIECCGEMSILSNCTSVYKAMMVAHDLIAIGRYKTVLVVSSIMASATARTEFYNPKVLKKEDLFLRWFLSDGAGAILFTRDEAEEPNGVYLEATYIESVGYGKEPMMYNRKESYPMNPMVEYENGLHHLAQKITTTVDENGDLFIITTFAKGLRRMAEKNNIDLSKTTFFNINFPSIHVYESIKDECLKMGIPENAFYEKLRTHGYVGPPMVFITVDKLLKEEKLNRGDQIISFVLEVSKIMQAGFVLKSY